jgi:hypothetical protein
MKQTDHHKRHPKGAIAPDGPHVVWGVDSARTANTNAPDGTVAFDSVTQKAGAVPAFWGRYIVGNYTITSAEAAYLHSKGCKILLVSNGPKNSGSSVQGGFAEGQADGNAAADAAAQALSVPAGVALYADIEGSWAVTSDWLRGWATAVTQRGFVSGFYGDCTPTSTFAQAYCVAQATEPTVTGSLLWSMEPEPGTPCQAAGAAPSYAPAAPSCGGSVVLWQYTEECWEDTLGTNAGIDMDLAMDAAISVMW